MKKVLIGTAVVLLLLAGGLAVFLLTFDINRYRPMVAKKASEALGAPVSIGRLGLIWQNGVAVSVEKLAIFAPGTRQAIASVDKAAVTVRLAPLLSKKAEIASVVLTHPVLRVERGADGQLILPAPVQKPAALARPVSKSSKPAPPLSIDNVRVDDAEIEFIDHSQNPARRLLVRDTDIRVKSFSMTKPFSFSARSSLFSEKQDVSVTGSFMLGQGNKPGVLKKADLNAELGLVNLRDASQFFPQIAQSGIQRLGGTLVVSVANLPLDQASLASLHGDLRLDKGSVSLKSLRVPVTNIQMKGSIAKNTANIDALTADIGSGKIKATATASDLSSSPLLRFNVDLQNLVLAELVPRREEEPGIDGVVSFRVTAQAATADLAHTLSGNGALSLRQGMIRNFNLVQEVFSRISIIPGITDTLMQRLPEAYRQKITARNTALMPVDLPFGVKNGVLFFNDLVVQTDHFVLRGAGQSDMSGQVLGQAAMQISPELSHAFRESVPQLGYFMDPRGQIEIPFRFQGNLPKPTVLPDMDALAPKLAVAGTQEVLTQILKRSQKKEGDEDPLASLLKKALS